MTAPTTRKHPGINTHRTTRPDRTLHRNIPVTSVLRTLEDLSSMLPFTAFRRAVRQAFNRDLITTAEIARTRSKPLRAIAADLVPTESVLEDYVHDLIREAGFDEPLVNVPLGPYKPDFRWPHRGLIVEADGAGTHDNDLARHELTTSATPHLVDADGHGEHQRVVFPGRHLDAVRVPDAEPAL